MPVKSRGVFQTEVFHWASASEEPEAPGHDNDPAIV
jgi:hypothetical protein